MNIITLDFETYFDQDYTLSKMTTEAYVRDPRFEAHGLGVRMPDGDKFWILRTELPEFLQWCNIADKAILGHHMQFDGLILAHHYAAVPAMYMCTMSMARAWLGTHISKSLGSLAEHYGLGTKTIDYDAFRGKHWEQMDVLTQKMLANGCCDDVELT